MSVGPGDYLPPTVARLIADDAEFTATVDHAVRKVEELKRIVERLNRTKGTATAALEDTEAKIRLSRFEDRLDALRSKVSEARVGVRGDDAARRRLDLLDIQLRRVGQITSHPNVDLRGVARAELALEALKLRLDALDDRTPALARLTSGLGGLGAHAPGALGLAATLTPAALPLAGVGVGAVASLLTPLAAATIGVGAFAAAAVPAYHKVLGAVSALEKAQLRVTNATTSKQRQAALIKERQLWEQLDPAQRAAVKRIQQLNTTWHMFQGVLEPQVFAVMGHGAGILTTLLGYLVPVAKATGEEIVRLESRAQHAFKDPFWQGFFSFLAGEAPRAIDAFGMTIGHLGTGLAHLVEAFAPLGHDFEGILVRLSARFEAWSSGSGPGKFVTWVEANGPGAAKTLGALANALIGLGKGLMPIGQLELQALTPVLNWIGDVAKTHPAGVRDLGLALITLALGLKAVQGAAAISSALANLQLLIGRYRVLRTVAAEAAIAEEAANNAPGGVVGGRRGGRHRAGGGGGGLPTTIGRLAGPLALVYASVAGGDVGPPSASEKRNMAANRRDPMFALAAVLDPNLHKDFPMSVYPGNKFSVAGAVGYFEQHGSAGQIAQLEKLAKLYPAVARALATYGVASKSQTDLAAKETAAEKALASAESQMTLTALLAGHSLTVASQGAHANRAALHTAAEAVLTYRQRLMDTGAPLDVVQAKTRVVSSALEQQATRLYGSKAAVDAFLRRIGVLPAQLDRTTASLYANGRAAGSNWAKGMIAGLQAYYGRVHGAAGDLARAVTNATKEAHMTQSPSRVARYFGAMWVAGLVVELLAGQSKAFAASMRVADGIAAGARYKNGRPFTAAAQRSLVDELLRHVTSEALTRLYRAERAVEHDVSRQRRVIDRIPGLLSTTHSVGGLARLDTRTEHAVHRLAHDRRRDQHLLDVAAKLERLTRGTSEHHRAVADLARATRDLAKIDKELAVARKREQLVDRALDHARRLAAAHEAARPGMPHYGRGGSYLAAFHAGTPVVIQHVTVQGSVWREKDLHHRLGQISRSKERRSMTNGFTNVRVGR